MSILHHSRPGVSSLLESLRGRTNHTPLALGTFPYDPHDRARSVCVPPEPRRLLLKEQSSIAFPSAVSSSSPSYDLKEERTWKTDKWTVIWPT